MKKTGGNPTGARIALSQDAAHRPVKLIYQYEFGGGHRINDEEARLNYYRREYESVEKDASKPCYLIIHREL